jgi:hypothetical protein
MYVRVHSATTRGRDSVERESDECLLDRAASQLSAVIDVICVYSIASPLRKSIRRI